MQKFVSLLAHAGSLPLKTFGPGVCPLTRVNRETPIFEKRSKGRFFPGCICMISSNACCRASSYSPECSQNSQSCDSVRHVPDAGHMVQMEAVAETVASVRAVGNDIINQALDFVLDFDELQMYLFPLCSFLVCSSIASCLILHFCNIHASQDLRVLSTVPKWPRPTTSLLLQQWGRSEGALLELSWDFTGESLPLGLQKATCNHIYLVPSI
jgi:hypothetical protein